MRAATFCYLALLTKLLTWHKCLVAVIVAIVVVLLLLWLTEICTRTLHSALLVNEWIARSIFTLNLAYTHKHTHTFITHTHTHNRTKSVEKSVLLHFTRWFCKIFVASVEISGFYAMERGVMPH